VKLSEELRRLLRAAGCEPVRQGRGDHKIWHSPKTGAMLVIDDGMKSRHIANRVLKAAGLPKGF
jgi:HicA-like toxin of HicAB toxin-antitoxin system